MDDARRTRAAACVLVLVATGCKKDDADAIPTLLSPVAATATGVWAGTGLGASPVSVPVYAINGLGAPVPGAAIALSSDEGTVAATVTPDEGGWGTAAVTGAGPGRYGVTAEAGGGTAAGAAWVVRGVPGAVDMPAWPVSGEPGVVARAAGGLAWAVDGELWWTSTGGAPAARVLALPDPITALVPALLDGDAITDLLVVSAGNVVALRGRAAGGLVWGGGWAPADGGSIVAASPSDADNDGKVDLGVALAIDDGTAVALLRGDEDGGFTAADALDLAYGVSGVSVEDLDRDGVSEISVLSDEGLIRRYTKIDGIWDNTESGWEYDPGFGPGAHLARPTDVTGDGIPDLVAWGPSQEPLEDGGTAALVWVISAGAAAPEEYPIVDAALGAAWVGLALGDVSGDGVADLVYTTPARLGWAAWTGTTFALDARADLPTGPAMDLVEATGDGVLDVALAGAAVRVLPGERAEGDAWNVASPDTTLYSLDLAAEPVVQDVDGDGIVDVVALVDGADGLTLEGLHGTAAGATDETLISGRALALAEGGTPVGLAVCDTRAFALYEAGGTWLARVDLDATLGATLAGEPVAIDGAFVACGAFAEGEAAVVGADGAVTWFDADGNAIPGMSIGTVAGIAVQAGAAPNTDSLVTCATSGCAVFAADLDADGAADVALQDGASVTVTLANGASYTADAPGTLRVDDADGDGAADLTFGDGGLAWVVRVVPGGLTPPLASWAWRSVGGAVRHGDLDGDGHPDAFLFGEDPDPTDSDTTWVGTLVYGRAE